jgi:hypothetical protein
MRLPSSKSAYKALYLKKLAASSTVSFIRRKSRANADISLLFVGDLNVSETVEKVKRFLHDCCSVDNILLPEINRFLQENRLSLLRE